jgi:hypothetical protein
MEKAHQFKWVDEKLNETSLCNSLVHIASSTSFAGMKGE